MSNAVSVKYAVTDTDVSELVSRRWSPRAFSDQKVTNEVLKSVFTAATWAASSRNEQPWRFVLGYKSDESYSKILASLAPANQTWAQQAPVLFATFAKQTFEHNGHTNPTATHDLGASTATLCLEATRHGLYVHGMAGFEHDLLQQSLNVPPDFIPVACWACGYLGDAASLPEKYRNQEEEPRERKPLSEVLFSSWGEPVSLTQDME